MARADTTRDIRAFRARGGNAAADFERLYRESYEVVYNYIGFRMAGDAAVEDVVAESFLKAAKSFGKFDPSQAKFSTWVVSIARNCMADHWRKSRPAATLDGVPDSVLALEDDYPSLNEDEALVRRLLRCLDDEARELVFMKYYEGKKNVDIARELGMNESTVATKLHRALRKMRTAAETE